MSGALAIHGIVAGPQVISRHPDLFWGLIASMWIGNLMLLVINLPLIGLWVSLLKIPYRLLFPAILVFCCIGIYSINNSVTDVFLAGMFGVFGYLLSRFGFEPVPLLLGFVLGKLIEENARQALILSGGSLMTFVEKPLSVVFLIAAALILAVVLFPKFIANGSALR
jgi:putative tricarboxylic transport membrane protein